MGKVDSSASRGICFVGGNRVRRGADEEISPNIVCKDRVQALRPKFETMFMGEEESVVDFAGKLPKVATQLRSLREKIDDGVLVAIILRIVPAKFDTFTSSIEKFGDMDSMSLEEAIGSLKIYEEKLCDQEAWREERLLLSKAVGNQRHMKEVVLIEKVMATDREEDEEEARVVGNNTSMEMKRDLETSPRYNCEKLGHFAYECRKSKKEEKAQVAEIDEKPQPTLLMTIIDTAKVSLLHEVNE